jgi:RNA polymerase sigma-70 factor (ECF subfamily)
MPTLTAALESVYRDCREQLFTCALHVTRCPARAEDAVHEAFSRLLRMDRAPEDLKVYVFRAVRNAAIDQITRRRHAGRAEANGRETVIFDPRDGPEELAGKNEFHSRLAEAIGALPEHERDAVVYHLYGDLTFKETARLLDAAEGTVAARYYRALEKLRTELQELP